MKRSPSKPRVGGSNPSERAPVKRRTAKRTSKGRRTASESSRRLARPLPVLDGKPFKAQGGWECTRCLVDGRLCAEHQLADLRDRVSALEAGATP
jgi:hypothetical protein